MTIHINKHNRKQAIKALAKKIALGAAATGMLLGIGASISQINANADDSQKIQQEAGQNNHLHYPSHNASITMPHESKSEEVHNQIADMKDAGIYNMLHNMWQKEGLTDEQGILNADTGSGKYHTKQINNNNESRKVNQHPRKHLRKSHHKTYPLTPKNMRGFWYRINHRTKPTTFDEIEVHNRNIEWGNFDGLETFDKHPLYRSKGSKNVYHFTEFDIRYSVKKKGPYLFLNNSKFRRINLKKVANKYGSSLSKLKYYARKTSLNTQRFATFVILLNENPSKVSNRINNDDF